MVRFYTDGSASIECKADYDLLLEVAPQLRFGAINAAVTDAVKPVFRAAGDLTHSNQKTPVLPHLSARTRITPSERDVLKVSKALVEAGNEGMGTDHIARLLDCKTTGIAGKLTGLRSRGKALGLSDADLYYRENRGLAGSAYIAGPRLFEVIRFIEQQFEPEALSE